MTLVVRPVTPARGPDLDRFFAAHGKTRYCSCMSWRSTSAEFRKLGSAGRRAAMRALVRGGTPVGLLAYEDGAPVAWCSVAPRETFVRIGNSTLYPDAPPTTWAIVCFFLAPEARGRGVPATLIDAAVEYAKKEGASLVEAYPVAEGAKPTYRHQGFEEWFRDAGFERAAGLGSGRVVMRLRPQR